MNEIKTDGDKNILYKESLCNRISFEKRPIVFPTKNRNTFKECITERRASLSGDAIIGDDVLQITARIRRQITHSEAVTNPPTTLTSASVYGKCYDLNI